MSAAARTLSRIGREFLGWDRPALPEAVRRLASRYRQDGKLDLGQVIVVVPGQRAGRRLQELLAYLAEDDKLRFTPPEVVTEGRVPEMLYTPKQPFASEVVQDLAWAQALRDLPAKKRQQVVPYPPAADEALRWLELAKLLRRLHVELAADGLDFAAVLRAGPKLASFNEVDRWEALVTVQQRYLQLLDRLELWDIQTARLRAIEFHEVRTDCDIILLGTVDLNNALRQMLDQVAAHVTAFIVAPEGLADHYDAHGCLVPEAWCKALVSLRDEQLCQVDGPEDQADAVAAWLSKLEGRFRNDEVAIGVPDESLVPQLQRQLQQCGVRGRWVEGVRLAETAPYRLLESAVCFAGRRRYEDLAALLRHPDLEDWLTAVLPKQAPSRSADRSMTTTSLPAQLDRFYNARLPSKIPAGQPLPINHDHWPDLGPALKHLDAWLEDSSTKHPLRSWGGHFRKILSGVYGSRTLDLEIDDDEVMHRTILRLLDECDRLGSIPEALDTISLSAEDAFRVTFGPLAREALPPPADPAAVEILGWLELPLDDSRALVVTSLNEGFVPTATGADSFLPDRLRCELGLLHNERRYARDAYATSVLCQSRENLHVIFARRDTKKDPLQPSRLIFACSDDALVSRAQKFFGERKTAAAPRRLLLAPAGPMPSESKFRVPPPEKSGEELKSISVTRFKDYLACPYRYYLRYVRELKAVDDAARELDGGDFGGLLHRVLSAFGRDPKGPGSSSREQEIFEHLEAKLEQLVRDLYAVDQQRAAIRLQLEQGRQRLRAFAREQAKQVGEGWRIVHAEKADETRGELSVEFKVDGKSILLIGRIDRIDFDEASRTIRIIDYKTGNTAQTPNETHRKKECWIDLQLPLYSLLWSGTGLDVPRDCKVQLAYFNLPKQTEKAGIEPAPWDEATLETAYERARQVIRDLRRDIFWKPTYPAPDFYEEFAAVCLDNVLGVPAVGDDDGLGVST
jgi:ATP-dependent helicase/nuclease subunit B